MKVNVGCGEHYVEGWHNTDVVQTDEITPDVVLKVGEKLPMDEGSVSRVYAGHVIEHMPWEEVEDFLRDLHRVLVFGGELLVVAPDVRRALAMHKEGSLSADEFMTIAEDSRGHQAVAGEWDSARHFWNCYEARLLTAVAGVFDHAVAVPLNEVTPDWPLVSGIGWQCAVRGVK